MKKPKKIKGSYGKPFYNQNIGENIRILRVRNFIKQQDFSTVLGISRQMLSHYENNKYLVPEEIVKKVIIHFNIELSDLLQKF